MTEITRINLVGQQRPWWNTGIALKELGFLRVFRTHDGWIRETAINVQAYSAYINELRHATMLEF